MRQDSKRCGRGKIKDANAQTQEWKQLGNETQVNRSRTRPKTQETTTNKTESN